MVVNDLNGVSKKIPN